MLLKEYLTHDQNAYFMSIIQNPAHVKYICDCLINEIGWDPEFVNYQAANVEHPFREVKHMIWDVPDYRPPEKKLIHADDIDMLPNVLLDREKKYNKFMNGEIDSYFRHGEEHPDEYVRRLKAGEYEGLRPVTVIDLGSDKLYDPIDGGHRIYLAWKNNCYLPAWVFKYSKNCNKNYETIKLRNLFR
jgi:hypothetical protein